MEISYYQTHSKLIEFIWPKEISVEILKDQMKVKEFLEKEYKEGIKEIRFGFNTLSLKLQFEITDKDCQDLLEEIKVLPNKIFEFKSKTWVIPVCYDIEFGKDLPNLSKTHGMEVEELIRLHSQPSYLLHFYGFLPGFMYLGGLNPRLYTPRKSNPDRFLPKGTVAIGGQQTGIYPMDSPGGWHAIGRSPIKLFDISKSPPSIVQIGDKIRFQEINKIEFRRIKDLSEKGLYQIHYD